MKCRTVTDNAGRQFDLNEDEERFVRAIERLEKMDSGRVVLFANGTINIRFNGDWYDSEIISTGIRCHGGDGSDND